MATKRPAPVTPWARAELPLGSREAKRPAHPHTLQQAAGLPPRKVDFQEAEVSGAMGLVGAMIRTALEEAAGGRRFTEGNPRARENAFAWLMGPGFDEWVSRTGVTPDHLRRELQQRLPWLREMAQVRAREAQAAGQQELLGDEG